MVKVKSKYINRTNEQNDDDGGKRYIKDFFYNK